MTTDQTNTGAGASPGAAPGGENSGNAGGSFMRDRVSQLAQTMTPAPGDRAAADGQQHQQQQTHGQQQPPPADQKIKVHGEYSAQELDNIIARDAEQQMRRNTLPKNESEFQARNSQDFQLPEGVRFEFNENDPQLAAARKFALSRGMSQEDFSALLDLHVAGQTNALMAQAQAREANLKSLGAAGPQRIEAVAQWLNARAGKDGQAVATFIKQFPSAPIVRAFESVIRQFTNQGNVTFDQRGRETQTNTEGKIPGYENMSFTQRRAAQMGERMRTDPSYARRSGPSER